MYTSSISSIALSLLSICTAVSALPVNTPRQFGNNTFHPSTTPTARAVINQDFPDPSFIKLPDGYYAFSTSSNNRNIQVARSNSFTNPSWSMLPNDVLPDPGAWTDRSHNIWAPYVGQTTRGTFVMYYAAPPGSSPANHCIGTATSNSILGPYTPSPNPFVCNLNVGGAIDPSIFRDPATGYTYVTYKIDGNSLPGSGHPTPIMLQRIDPTDLLTRIGPAVQILDQDPSGTDGPLVEAPTLMFADGMYYLLFSTHMYDTEAYDIRYVTSKSVTGPWDMNQKTLLRTGDGNGVVAPGSCDVKDGMILFHGTISPQPHLARALYAGYVKAQNGVLRYTSSAW